MISKYLGCYTEQINSLDANNNKYYLNRFSFERTTLNSYKYYLIYC